MGKSDQAQDYPNLLSRDSDFLSTSRGGRRNGGPHVNRSNMSGQFVPLGFTVEGGAILGSLYETRLHKTPQRDKGSNGSGHHSPYRIQRVVRSPSQHNAIIGRPGIRKIRAVPSTTHGMSPSQHNAIIGRPGIRKIRAVPSITHGMLKFPVEGGTVTLQSSRVIPMECAMISGPSIQAPAVNQVLEEKINIAIHPEYPEQTIAIGSTLTEKGRKELCSLLKQNLDIFAWKPADMTGVPRNIAEHRLNIREGYSPARQKKRGQAPERNKIIQEEVEKLVDVGIMKEEAEAAFKQIKKLIAELPTLTAPREHEELIIYLAAAKEAISAVLMTDQEGKQIPCKQTVEKILSSTHDCCNNRPTIKQLLSSSEMSRRMLKWKFELEGYDIQYRPRTAIKGQILADFIVERPEEESPDELMAEPEELPEPIEATKNEAEYEALIAGLRISEQMGVKNLQAHVDSRLVANQVNNSYIAKEPVMVEAKAVATITGNQVKKFVWDNIVCRFGLPGEIILDNGKQFRDNPFKDWCEKLCIRQCFASVKHPQANGLVERANISLGEGIKARLDERSKY
ncbi:reverse transcriptase domain-containing protein [Tanacetum coccineum]|uniref:Reverse transcriptase domain-containing protein n=1 Tax=Tanacetum coccineum TaxID=301880 RepID=A0ABQ5F7J7_9ASTR